MGVTVKKELCEKVAVIRMVNVSVMTVAVVFYD